MRLGKTSLNFNVNVDNIFNTGAATSFYQWRDYGGLWMWDEQVLSGNWDLADREDFIPDARFKMASAFYPPIAARVGIRFSF